VYKYRLYLLAWILKGQRIEADDFVLSNYLNKSRPGRYTDRPRHFAFKALREVKAALQSLVRDTDKKKRPFVDAAMRLMHDTSEGQVVFLDTCMYAAIANRRVGDAENRLAEACQGFHGFTCLSAAIDVDGHPLLMQLDLKTKVIHLEGAHALSEEEVVRPRIETFLQGLPEFTGHRLSSNLVPITVEDPVHESVVVVLRAIQSQNSGHYVAYDPDQPMRLSPSYHAVKVALLRWLVRAILHDTPALYAQE
jgi:hypothetical protein